MGKKLFVFFYFLSLVTTSVSSQSRRQMDRFLKVSSESLSFSAGGGQKSLTVTSSGEWKIAQNSALEWVTLTKNGNQLSVRVSENRSTSHRQATIRLSSGGLSASVTITQSAGASLSVSSNNLDFVSTGGSQNVTVRTNETWTVDNHLGNLGYYTKSGNTLTVTVNSNSGTYSRSGWLVVKAGNKEKRIDVSQAASQQTLTLSSSEIKFDASGGSRNITVTSNGIWNVSSNIAGWGHYLKNGNTLTVAVDTHSGTAQRAGWIFVKAGNIEKQIKVIQEGMVYSLSLSTDKLDFSSSGGTKSVNVTANKEWTAESNLSKWGQVTRNGNTIMVKMPSNTSTSTHTGWIKVKVGNLEKYVSVSQPGVEANLSVNGYTKYTSVHFDTKGGRIFIPVSTNVGDYTIGEMPWWCRFEGKSSSGFYLVCSRNYAKYDMYCDFKVMAGGKSVTMSVYQKRRRVFNHAQDHYCGGFSVGYIQKQWTTEENGLKEKSGLFDGDDFLQGIQVGFRVDPQFGAGFGINTGVFYEYCWAKSDDMHTDYGDFHMTYEEHALYAPLHLKYTMNFSKWFQLSLHGGVGLNYTLSSHGYLRGDGETYDSENVLEEEDNWKRFNTMLEYGASLRINALQFDVTMSKGLSDWSDTDGLKITQGRPLSMSATICF